MEHHGTKPPSGIKTGLIISFILVAIVVVVVLSILGQKHLYAVAVGFPIGCGCLLVWLGTTRLLSKKPIQAVDKIKIKEWITVELAAGGVIVFLGAGMIISPVYFLTRIVLANTSLRGNSSQKTEDVASKILDDKRSLNETKTLYANGQYQSCLKYITTITSKDDCVLDELAYFSIMADLRLQEAVNRLGDTVSKEDKERLKNKFERFISERSETWRWDEIWYWFGHFHREIYNNKESALKIFDYVVDNCPNSNWIQGSLYYSGTLHYEQCTCDHRRIATERIRTLKKVGGYLLIVDTGRLYSAAGVADKLLQQWNGARGQKINNVSGISIDSVIKTVYRTNGP